LDGYAAACDARSFFGASRAALRKALAVTWGMNPTDVTTEEVASKLGPDSELARVFALAEEAAYSTLKLTSTDFRRWQLVVLRYIDPGVSS